MRDSIQVRREVEESSDRRSVEHQQGDEDAWWQQEDDRRPARAPESARAESSEGIRTPQTTVNDSGYVSDDVSDHSPPLPNLAEAEEQEDIEYEGLDEQTVEALATDPANRARRLTRDNVDIARWLHGDRPNRQLRVDHWLQRAQDEAATVRCTEEEEDIPRGFRVAATMLSTAPKHEDPWIHEVNTKYKPVGQKVKPVATSYPRELNPPMKRPPLARDPYETPLALPPTPFEAIGNLTKERLEGIDMGPKGFLNEEERQLMINVLQFRHKALAFSDEERGLLKRSWADPYKIPTIEHEPWHDKPIPLPFSARPALMDLIRQRIKTGLYERTESSYSSRWFAVPKKDGRWRIVHSLERLNAVTIRDAGVPPVIEEFIEDLVGRSIYGLLDIFGGYDERELHEESRPLTAFQTPLGHLQLTRLPQGYTNAVAEQMRINRHVLEDEIPEHVQIFLDDNPIKGPHSDYGGETMPDSTVRRFVWEYAVALERILYRLEEAGLTAAGSKLILATSELKCLGTVVTKDGRRMAKNKINKIVRWPPLRCAKDVRSFLGMCTVVRIHIPNFAALAAPLRQLTLKRTKFDWTEQCEAAFTSLKHIVGEDIVLKELDTTPDAGAIILAVDSSNVAAGIALYQEDRRGVRYPVRYESVTFTATEQRYSQPKLELCGLVKSLKKRKLYIWGRHFIIEVDAQSLIRMINTPDPLPNAAMNRWLAYIALFDFDIQHVKAEKHRLPDALSRVARTASDSEAEDSNDMIDLGINSACLQPAVLQNRVYLIEGLYEGEWKDLGDYLETMRLPTHLDNKAQQALKKRSKNYFGRDGKMWKRAKEGMLPREVVLSDARQTKMLQQLHDELGHRGVHETNRRVAERAWWPKMLDTIRDYITSCIPCQLRNPKEEREPRNPTPMTGLFQLWNFDSVHIKYGRYKYMLSAHEDLSGWVEALPVHAATAETVAGFIESFISRYGQFRQARVDGGSEFKGMVIGLLRDRGVELRKTAPYSPESNGMDERMHRSLVDCLYKLAKDRPGKWHKHLPMALLAERISV